jgi:hypothetical protein
MEKLQRSSAPVILLRIAAALMLLHFVGHTLGMLQPPSHGPEEVAVIDSMKSHRFNMMGSMRTYWDFFLGFGYDASLNMILQAGLLWLLSRLARRDLAATRPFIAILVLAWIGAFLLYLKYFFIAPIIFAALMMAVLGIAWASAKRS